MKKIHLYIFLLTTVFATSNIYINNTNYINVQSSNQMEVNINLSIGAINFEEVIINNNIFTQMNIDSSYPSTKSIGAPNLSSFNTLIEIPRNSNIKIEIINDDFTEYDLNDFNINYPILPVQLPVSKSASKEELNFALNESIYTTNSYFSNNLISVNKKGLLREVEIANIIINPIEYNPVQNKIRVHHSLEFKLNFINANLELGNDKKQQTFSPYFEKIFQTSLSNYHSIYENRENDFVESVISYVIIADQSFESTLAPFIEWKTQKGFHMIVAYTNEIGSSSNDIKNFIQDQYNNPPNDAPVPSFILLVGDTQQIPASYSSGGHVSDLDYCDFTQDNIPDVLCGRFSAQNPSHLSSQINKTIEYEKYEMPDPSFLEDVIMISGVDASYAPTYGNGQINYGNEYYFNSTNNINSNTFLYPESGSAGSQILNLADQGASYINYTAHGWEDGWADPEFDNSDANNMINNHKYPTMVGNCCLTNAFDSGSCFGETLLRKSNGGAIGYIGGSDVTYWNEDYWWGVGSGNISANPSYNNTGLGAYDGIFHENNENNWAVVNSAISMVGNLAVAQANGMDDYYWEIYHLMGDPSISTYFGVPEINNVTHDIFLPVGSEAIEIQAEPFSYVGLSQNNNLLSSGIVDESGFLVLVFNPINEPGTVDIVVTGQNLQPYFNEIFVSSPDGAYITVNNVSLSMGNDSQISIGETVVVTATIENVGSEDASNIEITLLNIDNDPFVNLINSSETINNLSSGELNEINLSFNISSDCPYGHASSLALEINSEDNAILNQIDFNVEYLIEDFVNGSFNDFLWEFSGDENWIIDGAQFIGDSYSAKSGNIDHGMISELYISMDIVENGAITFDKKVSCEDVGTQTGNYYDYLAFYIDGIEQAKWAGEIGWSQNSFNVSQGEHIFLWRYVKDQGITSGDDSAWIDNVIFPPTYYQSYILGDVNNDGLINIQDVIVTVNIVLGSLEYNQSADMNNDNTVDVLDIISIVNIILN